MTRIRDIERNHEDPAHISSYYPWMGKREQSANEDNPESERVDDIGTGLKVPADAQKNGAPKEANGDIKSLRRAATIDYVRRKQFLKKYIEIGKEWKNWMVDCEGMNGTNGWRGHCRAIGLTDHLYRLNVEGDLHTIPLDDWRPSNTSEETLKFIEEQTKRYLAGPKVNDDITSIARKAVEIRRQRAATEQWERFAVDVIYRCPDCDNKKYNTRPKLPEHLQKGTEHRRNKMADGRELEEKLNTLRSSRPDRPFKTGR
ncbi:PNPLA domain-containing protein [Fusarium acuminatum]|uniref:PNPLA domain-containing protein n=1 Tax=Fusarium acuminatum TaxID=5515 RepID=A0ABZ2WN19_9HYPO